MIAARPPSTRTVVNVETELAAHALCKLCLVMPVVGAKVAPVADPARDAPRERVRLYCRVALLCLLEKPEFVATRAAEVITRVLVRRLRAVRALAVAPDLDFEEM